MPVKFVPVIREVVMYQDVVDYFKHPYSLMRRIGTSQASINKSRKRGYFGERLSWNIWKASNQNIRLTPIVEAKKQSRTQPALRRDSE